MPPRLGCRLLAAAAVLLTGVSAAPAEAAFPGRNGKIAYSTVGGVVKVLDPATGDEQVAGTGSYPSWSGDGSRLAFSTGADVVVVAGADGAGARSLGPGRDPTLSPDGRSVAAEVLMPCSDTCEGMDIFVYDIATGSARNLTNTPGVSEMSPAWSPDGRSIAVRRGPATGATANAIAVLDAVTGTGPSVTAGPRDDSPDWSPDGGTLVFTRVAGTGHGARIELWLVAAGGGTARPFVTDADEAYTPAWSPDGSQLLASDVVGGTFAIRAYDAATGSLRATYPCCMGPAWQPVPELTIRSGPLGLSSDAAPEFSFGLGATGSGGSFECRLDSAFATGAWAPCTSPFAAGSLADGGFAFVVREAPSPGVPAGSEHSRSFAILRGRTAGPAPAPAVNLGAGPLGVPFAADRAGEAGVDAQAQGATEALTLAGADPLAAGTPIAFALPVAEPGVIDATLTGAAGEAGASVAAALLARGRAKAAAAGHVRLRLAPTAAGRRRARARGVLRARLRVTFTPAGGTPSVRTSAVTLAHRRAGRVLGASARLRGGALVLRARTRRARAVRFLLSRDRRPSADDAPLGRAAVRGRRARARVQAPPAVTGPHHVLACVQLRPANCAASRRVALRAGPRPAPPAARPGGASGPPAEALIQPAGGSVGVVAPDGTRWRLDIPAGALDAPTRVGLAPLRGLSGAPFARAVTRAVQLSPAGRPLARPARLSVVPRGSLPLARQTGLAFGGSGIRMTALDPTRSIGIPVTRLEGFAIADATAAERRIFGLRPPPDAPDRLAHELAPALAQLRAARLGRGPAVATVSQGDETQEEEETPRGPPPPTAMLLINNFHNTLRPELDAAEDDPARADRVLATALGFIALAEQHRLDEQSAEVADIVAMIHRRLELLARSALDHVADKCVEDAGFFAVLRFHRAQARLTHLGFDLAGLDAVRQTQRCSVFAFGARATFTDRGPSAIQPPGATVETTARADFVTTGSGPESGFIVGGTGALLPGTILDGTLTARVPAEPPGATRLVTCPLGDRHNGVGEVTSLAFEPTEADDPGSEYRLDVVMSPDNSTGQFDCSGVKARYDVLPRWAACLTGHGGAGHFTITFSVRGDQRSASLHIDGPCGAVAGPNGSTFQLQGDIELRIRHQPACGARDLFIFCHDDPLLNGPA